MKKLRKISILRPETSKEGKDFILKLESPENKLDSILKWVNIEFSFDICKVSCLLINIFRSFKTSTEIIFTSCGLAIGLLGTVSFLDAIFHWAGSLYGLDSLSLAMIGEHIFPPVMWCIGINWSEADTVRYE